MPESSFPPMGPPNGERVTNAVLYKALYDFQGRMLEQFRSIDDHFTSIAERACIGERALAAHEGQFHPGAKTTGGVLAAAFASAVAFLVEVFRRLHV